jgi:uncharacterized protein YdaU (DUF1376 family)
MAGRRKDLGWFPMYATETLADERFQGWTCEERGAWVTLILVCWHEGSIPASPELLRRTLHLDAPAFRVIWEQIGNRFAPSDEDPARLVSPRLEKERAKANRIASERAKAGAEGGKAKAERGRKPSSNCQASAKQNPAVALANPAPTPTPTPTDPPPRRAALVSPFPPGQDPAPHTTAVLAALLGRGLDAAPPSAKHEGRVEAAIVSAGITDAVERLARVLADPNAQRPLTYHVDAIRGVAPKPASDRGRQPVGQDFTQQPKW